MVTRFILRKLLVIGICSSIVIFTPAVNSLAADSAAVQDFVTRFYQLCLDRNPDTDGLNGWVAKLMDGSKTGSDVAYGFVFSPEFLEKNTSNQTYLSILYKAFFNRDPDKDGWDTWLADLNNGVSREHVLNGFIFAVEFAELCQAYGILAGEQKPKTPEESVKAFVTRFYQLCLGRSPDPDGLATWTMNLLKQIQTGSDVANGFIYSREFIEKETSNEDYLAILYKAFFNRDPDKAGWDIWLAELDSGRDRGYILDGFLFSAEFAELCKLYGITPGEPSGLNRQPTLSVYTAEPGQFITIFHNSILAGKSADVDFKGPNGYIIEAEIENTADGSARVAVPVFIDPLTGAYGSAGVTVVVNGANVEGELTIKMPLEPDIDGGKVFSYILKKTVAEYQAALTNLQQIHDELKVDISEAKAKLEARIAALNMMISDIDTKGTVFIEAGSEMVLLDKADLKFLDRMLVATFSGIDKELTDSGLQAGPALNLANGLEFRAGLGETAEERLAAVQAMIDRSVEGFRRGLEGGKVYIGGVTLGFTIAGAMVGGPVGGLIGAAAGLAMAYFSAGYELGTSALYNKISQSISDNYRKAYDIGDQLLDQLVRVGAAAVNAATAGASGLANTIANFVSTSFTVHDTVKAAENTKCQPRGLTIDDFCNDTDPPVVDIENSLNAVISIPGYYAAQLKPENTVIWYSEVSDGQGNVILGDIPSVFATDGPLDESSIYNQTSIFLMISPYLPAGPGTYVISDEVDIHEEGGDAELVFHTPAIQNQVAGVPNYSVMFGGTGTLILDAFSKDEGALIKGSFEVDIEGTQDICPTTDPDSCTENVIMGTISGSFEGVLQQPLF